jgi:hypothetical protein
MRRRDGWTVVLGIAAAGNLANGLWMLASPLDWYWNLPAAVPDTGPLNEHFVRDLGATFTVLGVALGVAAVRPAARVPLVGLVMLFYVMHAGIHVFDTLRGLLPASHWLVDFPGVYLPALLMLAIVYALWRAEPAQG